MHIWWASHTFSKKGWAVAISRCICMAAWKHTYIDAHVQHTCMCVCMYLSMCICVCVHTFLRTRIHTYIHTHTHRLIVIFGGELFTGNAMYMLMAFYAKKVTILEVLMVRDITFNCKWYGYLTSTHSETQNRALNIYVYTYRHTYIDICICMHACTYII